MAGNSRRWWILGLGMAAQAASCVFIYGLPYLLPALRHTFGLSLGSAGLLITCPMFGVVLALIAWGAVADRYGERMVIAAGLAIAAAALAGAAAARGIVSLGILLVVAGAGGASVNAASGRLVLGWFGPEHRAEHRRCRYPARHGAADYVGGIPRYVLDNCSFPDRSRGRDSRPGPRGGRARCPRACEPVTV